LNKSDDIRRSCLDIVSRAVEIEHTHALRAVETLIDKTDDSLKSQIDERKDTLDAFFESQRDSEEPLRPQKAAEELGNLIRLPLRLTGEQFRQLGDDPDDFKKWLGEYIESQMIALNVNRIAGAIEHRLGESLGEKIEAADWNDAAAKILSAAQGLMQRQRERLVSQVEHDLDTVLQRESGADDSSKLRILMSLSQGARTVFDQRTHRQVRQLFNRFTYIYLAAHLLDASASRSADEVTDAVMDHLEQAESALQTAWGHGEYARLGQNATRLADFGPAAQFLGDGSNGLGSTEQDWRNRSVTDLSDEEREKLIQAIGSYVLNEVKRQLLLSAITELWVDYLTKVEALRVSIGLEAYAQRDPLVQYKGRASELFQQLLSDVRAAVIGRVFAYQPRRIEITPVEVPVTEGNSVTQATPAGSGRKKRKRH
jgi:preprotein translocase subunit SecA